MLWSFSYKKGPAPDGGMLEAKDDATAYKVMVAWGAANNCKVFNLRRAILADESILPKEEEPVAKWVETKAAEVPGPAKWAEATR